MSEKPYTKREQDVFHREIKDSIDRVETKQREGFEDVITRLDYTNSKIRKITIALVFAFGLIIGMGATDFDTVVKLLF